MRKTFLIALATAATVFAFSAPAFAITDGGLDGNGHPYVGLMVAQDSNGAALWRCSGTLMSDTVFMVAGHCTAPDGEDVPAHAEIWFSPEITVDPDYTGEGADPCEGIQGYPCKGDAGGSVHTHPQFDPNAFFLFDLGLVQIDTVRTSLPTGRGVLPAVNSLDALSTKDKDTFTSVGYGLQKAFPDASSWKNEAARVRMVAHPRLIGINGGYASDYSIILSNNASTGGTCFGDSGGPNFKPGTENVVAGVTSFGKNWTCGGQGGVYRVDRPDDLAFLAEFGVTP